MSLNPKSRPSASLWVFGFRSALVAAFLFAPIGLAGCGNSESGLAQPNSTEQHDAAGTNLSSSNLDDEFGNSDLATIKNSSDLVVQGTVQSSISRVMIGFDKDFDLEKAGVTDPQTQEYTVSEVQVDSVLDGELEGDTVSIAVLTHLNGFAVGENYTAAFSDGTQGVWLLKRIPPEFDTEGYVLTSGSSAITAENNDRLTVAGDSTVVHSEIERLSTLDAVADYLKAL